MLFRFANTTLFLFVSSILLSQSIDEKNFVHYSLRDGLSNNYISGIEQDSSGYIWIATRRGLNRFDGKTFKHFFHSDKYNPIPDNSIYSIKMLNNGNLGVATSDGTQLVSTRTLKQVNLTIADDSKLRYWSNDCMYVENDADGNYGVSTKTGFYIFSHSGHLKKRYDYYTRKDIGTWMIFGGDLFTMPDGNLVQWNQNGLLLYDRKKEQFTDALTKYPALNALKAKSNNIFFFISASALIHLNVITNSFDLIDVNKGQLASFPSSIDLQANINWITNGSKINDTTWAVNCKTRGFLLLTANLKTKTISCSPRRYFADKFCTSIFSDRNNNLWVGTNTGLFKQDAHPRLVETFKLPDEKSTNVVNALYIFKDKIFAGIDKKEILVIDKQSKKIIRSIRLPVHPIRSNHSRTFYLHHPDTLWVGTNSGLYWLHLRNYSFGQIEFSKAGPFPSIYLLFADKKKNVWVSDTEMNSIYNYDQKKKAFILIDDKANPLFKTNITSVAEDRSGNIWISGDAIVRWNPLVRRIDTLIEHLTTQSNFKKGYHVMADSKGDIWATVNDDGLVKLTGENIHLRPQNLTQEKSSFMLPALFNDKIFVYTPKGAGYFDITTLKSIAFTESDGIPQGLVSTSFFVEDASDGSIWFAINNTICKIPVLTSSNNLKPPVLNITALSILNDSMLNYPPPKISLNYKQGDINIFYSAINYSDPSNMQFAYRIKNKRDSSWIEAGDQQNILLTNISPGNYKFELKVSAFDNKWPEQIKELEIVINPPFWRTRLFYLSIALVAAASLWLLYRYRIKQIKQKAGLDKLIAQTEMKALHAQMNPHFIFNCLNSIREMILNNENEQASLYLSKFARLIRITLNQSSKPFVSLEDTIDYLERYIEMEKIRSDHFTATITVDDQLQPADIMLPPMLIQPFIENAIWHGAQAKNNLHVQVRFIKEENELVCVVDDNGMGINESLQQKESIPNQPSVGITNIKQRIALLNEKYNLRSTIKIEDKSAIAGNNETGTIVTLHLPIKTNESLWTT
jgi:ligand-binding sensor domain-containing protein